MKYYPALEIRTQNFMLLSQLEFDIRVSQCDRL